MNSSLDEMARILPLEIFIYLNKHFFSRSEKDTESYFHYSHIDSHARYTEVGLPARGINTLQGDAVSVVEKEYQHAWLVCNSFVCQVLSEYIDLYLTTDTLILAWVLEVF